MRALLATLALYVFQGVPVVLLLLEARGGPSGDSVFTVIPYWTGPVYIAAVVVFGLILLAVSLPASRWSRRTAVRAAVGATVAYALVSFTDVVTRSDSADYVVNAAMLMLVFIFLSGSVAFGCATLWSWRTTLAWTPSAENRHVSTGLRSGQL
jgi:hypothetical protein